MCNYKLPVLILTTQVIRKLCEVQVAINLNTPVFLFVKFSNFSHKTLKMPSLSFDHQIDQQFKSFHN